MTKGLIPWWVDSKNAQPLHQRLCNAAQIAWKDDAPRRARLTDYARIYLNRNIGGLTPDTYHQFAATEHEKIRVQITRTMVDSVQARVAKNRPKPTALTKRGGFELQDQAKRQDAFIWGVFQREKAYELGPVAFRDAMAFADGLIKVYGQVMERDGKKQGRIRFERVPCWEVFCDAVEAFYGNPRTLYQIHNIDRGVLKAMFPHMAGRIEDHGRDPILDYGDAPAEGVLSDRVQVLEAWRMPSAEGAGDGLHVLTMKSLVLTPKNEQRWTHERFPFARVSWAGQLPAGFWSQSLVETSRPIQTEINELAGKIQAAMFYGAHAVILVEEGANIEEGDLTNDLKPVIIRHAPGSPPQFHAPQQLNQEVYVHLDRLLQLAMNLEGVSELSVASKKPAGLDSGKALLDFNDIESERFILKGHSYEAMYLDLGMLTLMTARDMHMAGVDIEVSVIKKRFRSRYIEKIRWGEISIEEDQSELTLMPTSSLPHLPAGKRQAVESMFAVGFISRDQALELMEIPDTDAVLDRELARVELPLYQIMSILEDAKIVAPIPQQDLAGTLLVATQVLMRSIIDEIDPTKLDLLTQFIDACDALLEDAKRKALEEAQAAQAAMAPPAQPQPPVTPPS